MKLQRILEELENKAEIDALDRAMGDAFKTLGAEFKNSEAEIKQDVAQSEAEIKEVLDPITIIGFILTLPKIVELLAKGLNKLVAVFKKFVKPGEAKGNEEGVASNIIEFTHKWHKIYIKGLKWILKMSGAFDKAGIKGDASQTKAAEMIYYVIVAGLAAYSGIQAAGAFKAALKASLAKKAAGGATHFSIGAFEAALASLKSSEVRDFIVKLGLKSA